MPARFNPDLSQLDRIALLLYVLVRLTTQLRKEQIRRKRQTAIASVGRARERRVRTSRTNLGKSKE